ncbi:PD40 domain-containing protein [Endozoicomonas acroporae]|uniref:PD40 domain-containing protein n=1 Tax=Endozoicomonas acroporae TaxID=1701104 RepID=UPI0015E0FDE6|nr:PD40 domain-containing protein [Endozoicomonas acroporae]
MQPAAGLKTSPDVDTAGNEIQPEVVHDIARFDHRWVRVPQEVFAKIASYLSISDIHNFGQASPTTGDRLRLCGLTEVHYFLSLTRQRQSSCRAIIQSSQQLLEHLRTLSIFSVRHFPAQLGPAFYSFYANHLRQQILDGTALTLIPSGSTNFNPYSHKLLGNHIPILIKRKSDNYSDILALNHGHLVRKAEIKHDNFAWFRHQHADHILFVPQSVTGTCSELCRYPYWSGEEHLLSVYECRNGEWVEQQQLTTGDVFPQHNDKHISKIYLSPDARSLVCFNLGQKGAILGRGADGQWVNRGNIGTAHNRNLLFSADSKHLVFYDESYFTIMGQADDESWSQTGNITVEDRAEDLKLTSNAEKMILYEFHLKVLFSPDNRHFAIYFDDDYYDEDVIERDYFFVVIVALDPQGQWREKKRIIKTCKQPTNWYHLKPNFSPDGRLLIITSDDMDIWELNTDDQWLPAVQEKDQYGGGTIHFSADPCEFITQMEWWSVTIWRKAASGIWGQAQTFPAECVTKVSPNGETIVFNDPAGHTDIYQRKPAGELCAEPAGEWVRQRIEFSVEQVGFNQEGYLLAVVPKTDSQSLILFGLTAEGSWLERSRLQTEDRIRKFCFSPSSGTIQIDSFQVTGLVVSFWQIMPDTVSR